LSRTCERILEKRQVAWHTRTKKVPDPPTKSRSASLAVAAGILLSRIAGLVRERIFAHYLGNSDAAGAFKAALRIPNLLQNLFGEGVLSASFIPVYARLLAEGKEEEAGRVAGVVASFLALIVAVLVGVGTLFSRELIDVIAPGFTGDVREVTIDLVKIMFSGVGLLVLSAWCLGILNSHKKFFLSYVAPVLWNVAIIAALVFYGGGLVSTRAGQMALVDKLAWATVVGAGLQLGVQLPRALTLTRGLRPSLSTRFQPARQVGASFVPVLVSRGVVQLSAYIDQILASYLGPAAVSAMLYAQQLYLLPVSLFGMAVAAAELPEMSRAIGTPEEVAAKLRGQLTAGFQNMSFFVVPSVVAFLALGDVVVAALYQTGRFGGSDTTFVWLVLAGSTLGLLASTQARLCASAFYALRDTRTPLWFAIVRVTVTGGLGYVIALPVRKALGWPASYGAAGLTASAGLAGWIEFVLLKYALGKRIGRFAIGAGVLVRAWIAALLACAPAFALHRYVPIRQPLVSGAAVLGLYGALYFVFAIALGLDGAKRIARKLRLRR
jgi:putative peptidoglycan lipid II flippase